MGQAGEWGREGEGRGKEWGDGKEAWEEGEREGGEKESEKQEGEVRMNFESEVHRSACGIKEIKTV